MPYFSLASTTIERPSGVSSASDASCAASASVASLTPGAGTELGRLPVAQRDRAGLVEQQRVDVAGRFDRAARHRQHVVLDQAIHAGDADRRDQRADRRRNQADEQRDQHRDRNRRCRRSTRTAAASRRRAGRSASAPRAGCSARSRWASSAAPRLRPARSCDRGTSRPGST